MSHHEIIFWCNVSAFIAGTLAMGLLAGSLYRAGRRRPDHIDMAVLLVIGLASFISAWVLTYIALT